MASFEFEKTCISGLTLIHPFSVDDCRGYYIKGYERDIFLNNGIDFVPQEICGSISHKGVIRGLHFQTQHSQSKLVRCAFGTLYDVAVDLRADSETFGKWFGVELSDSNKKMLYIPQGFAHGVMALSDTAVLTYSAGEKYLPNYDTGIIWNDKTLAVNWPLDRVKEIIVSEKDKHLLSFADYVGDCTKMLI